jgi:uncharacterized protein YbcV (DUF1398 family)
MDSTLKAAAQACLDGAESGGMTFPQIVAKLMAEGFDGYEADLRAGEIAYYLPDGSHVRLPGVKPAIPVAACFDAGRVRQAIREAQSQAPGYSYAGFCEKVAGAGCAGYLVSFPGRRVLYFGRDGGTHTEYFPT